MGGKLDGVVVVIICLIVLFYFNDKKFDHCNAGWKQNYNYRKLSVSRRWFDLLSLLYTFYYVCNYTQQKS